MKGGHDRLLCSKEKRGSAGGNVLLSLPKTKLMREVECTEDRRDGQHMRRVLLSVPKT